MHHTILGGRYTLPDGTPLPLSKAIREQIARLMKSRGWSEAEARARLEAQRTNEEYSRAADTVLVNRDTPEALALAARAAVQRLLEARAERSRARS